jgi:hypothetical protein
MHGSAITYVIGDLLDASDPDRRGLEGYHPATLDSFLTGPWRGRGGGVVPTVARAAAPAIGTTLGTPAPCA